MNNISKNPKIRILKIEDGFSMFFAGEFIEVDNNVAHVWSNLPTSFNESELLNNIIFSKNSLNLEIYHRLKECNYLIEH